MKEKECSRVCYWQDAALIFVGLVLILGVIWLLAGCSYTINLTVSLPTDDQTPTVSLEPQPQMPQTKPDRFDL